MKQKHSNAVQEKLSQKSVQKSLSSKHNIPNEKETQSKEFEGPMTNIEILSFIGSPLQSTNLHMDNLYNTQHIPKSLNETRIIACLPNNKADSANAHTCPNCPYFSTRRNDLNSHISACHRPSPNNKLNTNFEDFIESCELQYLESPKDQIQVTAVITNQDSQPEITSACDINTEYRNILSTQPGEAKLSGATSSFFDSLIMFMEKPTEGVSIFDQYEDYHSQKEELEKERTYT